MFCLLLWICDTLELCPSHSTVCTACSRLFFFNDTATTEIYTLSLHDALPISRRDKPHMRYRAGPFPRGWSAAPAPDRKSTRLNSSHTVISYAVFCLKKKKKTTLVARLIHYTGKSASGL